MEDTAIGAGESATRSRSVGFKQEYTKNNPPQDPLQRDIREWSNSAEKGRNHNQPKGKGKGKDKGKGKGKRKHPGKGNRNQDQAGSPDEETGQRRLDDFGVKRQRVEFVGDVQENDDFFLRQPEWIEQHMCVLRSKVQECHDRFDGNCQVRRREFFSGTQGSEEPAGTHETKLDQSTGEVLVAVGCRDDRPIVDSESVVSTCPVDVCDGSSDRESPLQSEFGECLG